jgi:acetylornithine/succinyldiaminopimelate/putrescine aminotransferase
VGAALLSQRVAEALSPGDHGTTYGGNLLACRAALTFLDVVDGSLLESIRRVGAYLQQRVGDLAKAHPDRVVEARGVGLFAGLELNADAQPVVTAALERGLLINRTATTVIRLLPPYIAAERDIDQAIDILGACL